MMNKVSKLPLLLMAGTDFDKTDPLLGYAGVEYKSLIKIGGKTILNRMIEQFHLSNLVSRFYIMGLPEDIVDLPPDIPNIEFIETEALTVPERIKAAWKHIQNFTEDVSVFPGGDTKIFFVSADIPFVTAEIIQSFYNRIDFSKQLHISIVEKRFMDMRFKNNGRTYAKFKDGKFAMGDLASFDLSMVDNRMKAITTFRESRKNFYKVIFKLQPFILFKYLLNRLTLSETEKLVNKIFDVKSQIIQMEFAEIGFDIDKPEQLEIARKDLS